MEQSTSILEKIKFSPKKDYLWLAGDLIKIGDFKKIAYLINNYKKNRKNISKKIDIGLKNFNRFDYNINCKKYLEFVLNNF